MAMTERARVLVVEDVDEQRMVLERVLDLAGFEVEGVADGAAVAERAKSFDPDVVLLDLVLPGVDGIEVCRSLRQFTDAYVVMVTGKADEFDRVMGLVVGADDYVTKPFGDRELVARIRAMLRRPRRGRELVSDDRLELGVIRIDPRGWRVWIRDVPVELTRTEFDLLATLCRRPSMVFSRGQLLDATWEDGWSHNEHVIDAHMRNLRRKIDLPGAPSLIRTVRGVGYQIVVGAGDAP